MLEWVALLQAARPEAAVGAAQPNPFLTAAREVSPFRLVGRSCDAALSDEEGEGAGAGAGAAPERSRAASVTHKVRGAMTAPFRKRSHRKAPSHPPPDPAAAEAAEGAARLPSSPAAAGLLRVEVEDAARRLQRAMAERDAALERIDKLQADADALRNAAAASAIGMGMVTAAPSGEEHSYQVERLVEQNRLLNAELVAQCELRGAREEALAVMQSQLAEGNAALEATRAESLELLGAIFDGESLAEVRERADVAVGRVLADGAAAPPARRVPKRPGVGDNGEAVYYDHWGFPHGTGPEGGLRVLELGRSDPEATKRWKAFFSGRPEPGVRPPKEERELKEMVRGGIPDEFRPRMWGDFVAMRVGSVRARAGPDHYASLLRARAAAPPTVAMKQIELDLLRTFPTNKYFDVHDAPKIQPLRNVLVAYSGHNPRVGYCQGLNMIAALGLLFLSEEDAFWMLVAVVESVLPQGYYSETMESAQADQRVLRELLQERCPKVHAHLQRHGIDVTMLTFNWMLVVFIDAMPVRTVLRIWDAFLYEGSKVQFRASLGVFLLHQQAILEQDDKQELWDLLRRATSGLHDANALMKCAFVSLDAQHKTATTGKAVRTAGLAVVTAGLSLAVTTSGFSMRAIRMKREKYEREVRAEMEEQDRRRAEMERDQLRPEKIDDED